MKKSVSRSSRGGFTLIEIVVSTALLAVVCTGFLMMTFADEIYREQKSVLVSYMDVEAVYESGEDGQETYQGMKGIVEVRYYYEEIG